MDNRVDSMVEFLHDDFDIDDYQKFVNYLAEAYGHNSMEASLKIFRRSIDKPD